jgi:competence protein ComEC
MHTFRKRLARSAHSLVAALALLGVAVTAGAAFPPEPPHGRPLEIAFLDVGQGDAALITAPDGQRVLIDAGPRGSGVADHLRRLGIDTLDLVVASHNHADHIGGMREVLAAVTVRNYMDNGLPSPTATYIRLVEALERSGARVLDASARTLTLGDVMLHVLPAPADAASQNDRSVGIIVQYGRFHAFFTGDAEEHAIRWWLAHSPIPRMSVVKVSHHGSRNGTTPELVRTTHPAVAIISVGARNSYGHPSALVLSMWSAVARYVLRTDREGTIVVHATADGGMRLSTQRGTSPLRGAVIRMEAP